MTLSRAGLTGLLAALAVSLYPDILPGEYKMLVLIALCTGILGLLYMEVGSQKPSVRFSERKLDLLYQELGEIANTDGIITGIVSTTFGKALLDPAEKEKLIRQSFEEAGDSVRIIAYSMISWKDEFQEAILDAVRRKVAVSILILDKKSEGIIEKTLYESFQGNTPTGQWKKAAKELYKAHAANFDSAVTSIKAWRESLDESTRSLLRLRSYRETPNFYAFLFDSKRLYFSTYYLHPVQRGFRLPFVYIEKGTDMLGDILIGTVDNWFRLKFATGKELV